MVNEAGDLFFISPFVSINFLSFEGKKVVVKSVFYWKPGLIHLVLPPRLVFSQLFPKKKNESQKNQTSVEI